MTEKAIFDPEQLLRLDLREFPPYSMGHIPMKDLDRVIKLDLNENSFGPSPKAIEALAKMAHYHRYVGQEELREEIADYVGVGKSHIVVSNGADEMIDLTERVFLDQGDWILDCPPSFEMYSFFARLNGGRIVNAPRREDFTLDLDAIERSLLDSGLRSDQDGSKIKLVFVTSPSNPDGGVATHNQIDRLLKLPAMIVLDEAYAEFAGESYAARVLTQPNLIVLRSFSKWAGLASLRIGYCIAPDFVADRILRCKSPENVNSAGIVAARASLQDRAFLLANVEQIVQERERLSVAFARLGFLQPLPSRANFILCHVQGHEARHVYDELRAHDILVRAFNSPRLIEYIRFAVGTPHENEILLDALEKIGPA